MVFLTVMVLSIGLRPAKVHGSMQSSWTDLVVVSAVRIVGLDYSDLPVHGMGEELYRVG